MSTHRRLMTAIFCALALLTNGTTGALAQTQQRVRQLPPPPPHPDHDVLIERQMELPRVPGMPPGEGFFKMEITPGAPGESAGFSFVSSEMSFDSKIVKGAPYSAEAVTESVQLLADGNRITRKFTATLYRDGEGRTRREHTLDHVGPWATADDPPQTIFINDPVAGANYVLNPRTHTAQKMNNVFVFTRTPEGGAGAVAVGGPARVMTMRSGDGSNTVMMSSAPAKAPISGGSLSHKAVKKVQPVYPPVAKAAGAQGPVSVQIVIGEAGEVVSAKAISGHPLLQQAAVDAAQEWRFTPTKLSGEPVKVSGMISFVFALPSKDGENAPAAATPPVTPEGERVRQPGPPHTTESLGKQTIEGVEAEGTRTTTTIPAGMMGNERPLSIVSERWYSPELQTVVLTKHNDPRFGETSYRLTNINRSEPARTLFEVPSDYTLKTEQAPMRRMRMQQQQPSKDQQ